MIQTVENSLLLKGFFSEWDQIFNWQNRHTVIFTLQSKYPEYQSAFHSGSAFQKELIENYQGLLLKGEETLKMIKNGV